MHIQKSRFSILHLISSSFFLFHPTEKKPDHSLILMHSKELRKCETKY